MCIHVKETWLLCCSVLWYSVSFFKCLIIVLWFSGFSHWSCRQICSTWFCDTEWILFLQPSKTFTGWLLRGSFGTCFIKREFQGIPWSVYIANWLTSYKLLLWWSVLQFFFMLWNQAFTPSVGYFISITDILISLRRRGLHMRLSTSSLSSGTSGVWWSYWWFLKTSTYVRG